nr:uncharacterized protein LOC117360086 isoform X2 [Geotrypetes seraphini]XP_033799625.1 uncharacterized protein LOC117360086 isoform X2 [Geotrypetes seraphini]XP_033799626.1 uncharacterized protein LOC117360086 isoform X2 [Geotrypetes seraphini]XP_033799627.1 uncharacterized protein LOC117360086 isoform X2 [Geotrypetes seraphini]
MPHTKRKGTVKANPTLTPSQMSSPIQQSLDRYTVKLLNQTPVGLPAGELEEGASTALGLDASLSPPANLPPPCPAGEQGEMTLLGLDEDTKLESHEGGVSPVEPKDHCQGSIEPPTMGSTVVTLDTVWKAIQNLTDLVFKLTQETTLLVSKVDNLSKSLEVNKQETLAHFVQADKDVAGLKTNRRLNLRLLNFPRMTEMAPVDLLRKYFVKILDFSSTNIPPLNKVYYLPYSSKKEVPASLSQEKENHGQIKEKRDLIQDLSAILEESLMDVTERSTLLVSFVFENDLNLVMKHFFFFENHSHYSWDKRSGYIQMLQRLLRIKEKCF